MGLNSFLHLRHIQLGKTIELDMMVTPDELQNIVRAEKGLLDRFRIREQKSGILVWFEDITIGKMVRKKKTGRIVQGKAVYPIPCTVLDPFGGTGTVGLVADRFERDAILIELNPEYAEMSRQRILKDGGMFADVSLDVYDNVD